MEGVRACLLAALAAISCTASPEGTASTPRAIPPPAQASPTQVAASPGVLLPMEVERAFPKLSFTGMTAMAFPDDGSDRLFVALKEGRIVAFANDQDVDHATTFLDISRRVNDRGTEEGLLGLAVDPAFEESGHVFVYYSASSPRRIVVSRFEAALGPMGVADPESERVVLEVRQPYSNHNGGQVAFGPDGYLYIGLGDGGSRGDPAGPWPERGHPAGHDTADRREHHRHRRVRGALGQPLRRGRGQPETRYGPMGLRNPWRFSFDRQTGWLWAADVGQWNYEEVHVVQPGGNYGWNIMEGSPLLLAAGWMRPHGPGAAGRGVRAR